jgi:hypothetical protein
MAVPQKLAEQVDTMPVISATQQAEIRRIRV